MKTFGLGSSEDLIFYPTVMLFLYKQKTTVNWQPLRSGMMSGLALIAIIFVTASLFEKNVDQTDPKPIVKAHPVEATTLQPRSFMLTNTVQVAMARATSFEKLSDTKIKLREGSVWLDVEKGGAGFEVATDNGVVHVTGTSFGVKSMAWKNSR